MVAFLGAFHGRSMGSVSLTASKAKYRAGCFGPGCPEGVPTPFGDFEYLEQVVFKRLVTPEEVAAIVVEPILGEGGYVLPPDGWLRYLRELCDRHGILLVADEVQSGMGRTGQDVGDRALGRRARRRAGRQGHRERDPARRDDRARRLMTWDVGAHGSTYGGNPLACAAALATIELIEDGLIDNAREVGGVLLDGLRGMQERFPADPRRPGLGLMIGMEFVDHDDVAAVEHAAFQRGLLVLGCGDDVIRMSPPLVFRERPGEDRARRLRGGRRRGRGGGPPVASTVDALTFDCADPRWWRVLVRALGYELKDDRRGRRVPSTQPAAAGRCSSSCPRARR